MYVGLDTPFMEPFEKFLLKKYILAVNAWGANTTGVKDTQLMLEKFAKDFVPDESHRHIDPAPVWTFSDRIGRIYRKIMHAEFLIAEWAEHFRGFREAELDEIAASFKFENCSKREGLDEVPEEHYRLVKK